MKNNKSFLLVILLLVVTAGLVLIVGLFTNNDDDDSSDTATQSITTVAEDSYHLTDNGALYEAGDYKDVQTMHLTISRGNDSDNANYSWPEVNNLSVYDYEKMGADRYKISVLLQVGDENGPVAGELGYGESISNATV